MHKHVLTRKGLALLGKSEAELATPNVTKVVAGEGFAHWDTLEDLTEVLEPVAEMEIGEKRLIDGATVRLPVQLSNLELTETALIRQIGVYSMDPEEGEILYQIVQYDLPVPLPSYAANNGGVIVFGPELDILFRNAGEAAAPVTPGFLVTAKTLGDRMDAHNRSPEAHPDIRQQIAQLHDELKAELEKKADVEYGEFTPYIIGTETPGNHTYERQWGHYARVGTIVTICGEIRMASFDSTMSGDICIEGLPPLKTGYARCAVSFAYTLGIKPPDSFKLEGYSSASHRIYLNFCNGNTGIGGTNMIPYFAVPTFIFSMTYPVLP